MGVSKKLQTQAINQKYKHKDNNRGNHTRYIIAQMDHEQSLHTVI